ncbi:hypothetical protein BGW38_004965, partial [Lunasporangiospora selenospora]
MTPSTPQRPKLQNPNSVGGSSHSSSSSGNSNCGSNGSGTGTNSVGGVAGIPAFYHFQPSARSPLSQETTPFGLFRHKNLSTSALPSSPAAIGSSSNLALAPVTSTLTFSPRSSSTNLTESSSPPQPHAGGGHSTNNNSSSSSNNNNNSSSSSSSSSNNINSNHSHSLNKGNSIASSITTLRGGTNFSPSTPILPPLPPLTKVTAGSSPKVGGRPSSFQYTAQFHAWWDYIARDHDELSFRKGDILLVSREFDDYWCLGSVMKPDKRTSARHGFFPLQFCSLESHCYVPPTRVATRNGAIPGTEPGCRLNVVQTYNPASADELALRPGNQVRAIHFFEDGWVYGEQIDSTGLVIATGTFPAVAARPVTASAIEQATAASKQQLRHVNTMPQVPTTQDNPSSKASARQREESNGSASTFNTLYSHPNSSSHMLQHYPNNSSVSSFTSSTSTVKLPGSPTSSPFNTGQQPYRVSPPIIPNRSPLSALEHLRSGTNPNRMSIQSTTSSVSGKSTNNASTQSGAVTEEQVIQALMDRPVKDALLERYLSQGGDPNILDGNGSSLLHLAIISSSQASLVFLLSAPDIQLEQGSPLFTAVRCHYWKAAQQLLVVGANPNVHDECGYSVLHTVLLNMTEGDMQAEEVVQLLCDSKADVNCLASDKKSSPLAIAVERRLWAEVEILMAYGANPYLISGKESRLSTQGAPEASPYPFSPMPAYCNDPLMDAVNEDKVHLVRLLLKYYYAPTSFSTTSTSPSPSPSSSQSSQSFFGPHHPALQQSSASSFTTNNGSSGNINIPTHVPGPFVGTYGQGAPSSIPSPSSAQSSPSSAVLASYMNHRDNSLTNTCPTSAGSSGVVGSPMLTALAGNGLIGSFTNTSSNANMINMVGGLNPVYLITPKLLLQALTLAKELGHNDCLQTLSRPEATLKEGTLYGSGSYGLNQFGGGYPQGH